MLMVPPEAFLIDSAHSSDDFTIGWVAGTQCENFSSTGLSCASAGAAARPAATSTANVNRMRVTGILLRVGFLGYLRLY